MFHSISSRTLVTFYNGNETFWKFVPTTCLVCFHLLSRSSSMRFNCAALHHVKSWFFSSLCVTAGRVQFIQTGKWEWRCRKPTLHTHPGRHLHICQPGSCWWTPGWTGRCYTGQHRTCVQLPPPPTEHTIPVLLYAFTLLSLTDNVTLLGPIWQTIPFSDDFTPLQPAIHFSSFHYAIAINLHILFYHLI